MIEVAQSFRRALTELDPALLSGDLALVALDELSATENAVDAAQARVAARVAETGAYRARGHCDGPDHLARTAGCSIGEARRAIDTAN